MMLTGSQGGLEYQAWKLHNLGQYPNYTTRLLQRRRTAIATCTMAAVSRMSPDSCLRKPHCLSAVFLHLPWKRDSACHLTPSLSSELKSCTGVSSGVQATHLHPNIPADCWVLLPSWLSRTRNVGNFSNIGNLKYDKCPQNITQLWPGGPPPKKFDYAS